MGITIITTMAISRKGKYEKASSKEARRDCIGSTAARDGNPHIRYLKQSQHRCSVR
jgi:hypothetical protein